MDDIPVFPAFTILFLDLPNQTGTIIPLAKRHGACPAYLITFRAGFMSHTVAEEATVQAVPPAISRNLVTIISDRRPDVQAKTFDAFIVEIGLVQKGDARHLVLESVDISGALIHNYSWNYIIYILEYGLLDFRCVRR